MKEAIMGSLAGAAPAATSTNVREPALFPASDQTPKEAAALREQAGAEAGRGLLYNRPFWASIAQLGTALAPPGSTPERIGQAAYAMHTGAIYDKAMGRLAEGRPIRASDVAGLPPELATRVASAQSALEKERRLTRKDLYDALMTEREFGLKEAGHELEEEKFGFEKREAVDKSAQEWRRIDLAIDRLNLDVDRTDAIKKLWASQRGTNLLEMRKAISSIDQLTSQDKDIFGMIFSQQRATTQELASTDQKTRALLRIINQHRFAAGDQLSPAGRDMLDNLALAIAMDLEGKE